MIQKNMVGKSILGGKTLCLLSLYQYAKEKTRKIYKPYMISIFLCVPITLYQAVLLHGIKVGAIRTVSKVIFVPFLIQSATGLNGFSHAFNGVCWFLSTLFILYMAYPLLNKINGLIWKRKRTIFLMIIFIIIFNEVWHAILRQIERSTPFDALSYESPYFRIICFTLGILICDIRYHVGKIKYANIIEFFVLTNSVLWWMVRNAFTLSQIGLADAELKELIDMLLMALCIFVFSYESGLVSRVLRSKIFVLLGDSAMFIFLYHSVFIGNIVPISEVMHLGGKMKTIVCLAVITVGTAVSVLIYNKMGVLIAHSRDKLSS